MLVGTYDAVVWMIYNILLCTSSIAFSWPEKFPFMYVYIRLLRTRHDDF